MVGAQNAAEEQTGEGVARSSGHPRRVVCVATLLGSVFITACSAVPPVTSGATLVPASPQTVTSVLRSPNIDKLTGLNPAELVSLFGQPDFRRPEGPAELWQYRSADCVLDIFLYGDASGYHVVHTETRERSLVQVGVGRCGMGGDAVDSRIHQSQL